MRYLCLFVAVSLSLLLAACDGDDEGTLDEGGRLISTPPGGVDFGVLQHFAVATHEADITGLDDEDGYPLTLAADSLVIISVESLDIVNPFVELYDADGFFITADEDGGIGTDALIVGEFGAGDYTVVVLSSLDGPVAGDYQLNVLVGAPGADLEILDVGAAVALNDIPIAAGEDAQSYVFTLSSPSTVDIAALQSSGAADLALQLVNQRGAEVFFIDPDGLNDPLAPDVSLDRGTYLLSVTNELNAGAGVYNLTVEVRP
jgi:hypothetical protein